MSRDSRLNVTIIGRRRSRRDANDMGPCGRESRFCPVCKHRADGSGWDPAGHLPLSFGFLPERKVATIHHAAKKGRRNPPQKKVSSKMECRRRLTKGGLSCPTPPTPLPLYTSGGHLRYTPHHSHSLEFFRVFRRASWLWRKTFFFFFLAPTISVPRDDYTAPFSFDDSTLIWGPRPSVRKQQLSIGRPNTKGGDIRANTMPITRPRRQVRANTSAYLFDFIIGLVVVHINKFSVAGQRCADKKTRPCVARWAAH